MDIKDLDVKITDLRGRLNQKASSGGADRDGLARMNNRLSQLTARKHAAATSNQQSGMLYQGSAVKAGGNGVKNAHQKAAQAQVPPGNKHNGKAQQNEQGNGKHQGQGKGKHQGQGKGKHQGQGNGGGKAKAQNAQGAGNGGKGKHHGNGGKIKSQNNAQGNGNGRGNKAKRNANRG